MAENDGSPTAGAPGSESRERRPGKHKCEFCECTLTADGEVFKMSDKAKAFSKSDDKIAALESEITSLEGTIETLRAEVADLKTKLEAAPVRTEPEPRKSFLVGSR